MITLDCPHCGNRNAQEFRYGGEYNPRPNDPAASSHEWTDFLYMRANELGIQREWWYHRSGCGAWFLADRHTKSNKVERTFAFGGEADE